MNLHLNREMHAMALHPKKKKKKLHNSCSELQNERDMICVCGSVSVCVNLNRCVFIFLRVALLSGYL